MTTVTVVDRVVNTVRVPTGAPVAVVVREVIKVLTVGQQGPAGASAASYLHTQASASAAWTINHNLGFRPNVSVRNNGGMEVWAEVLHVSVNQALVSSDVPFAGTATCS